METHHQNRSEVIFPVLEHVKLDFGTGRVYVCHIMINIAISNMPNQGPNRLSEMETHHQKSSKLIIPVLEHFGFGRVTVHNIMINHLN